MKNKFKRVNIQIREDQHQRIIDGGVSIAGLVRDLLDDHFSENTIVLNVSRKSKEFYDKIIANFGGMDEEIEKYFVKSLDLYLREKLSEGEALRKKISESMKRDSHS